MGISSETSRPVFAKPVRADGLQCVPATVADHIGIETFLSLVFHGPTPREFQSQLEDPFYEPSDRLLVKKGSQVVAHVRKIWRTMRVGATQFPIGALSDLGVLPEYRSQGLIERLFSAAVQAMHAHHVTLVEFDERAFPVPSEGWIEWRCDAFSQASPRDILAQLSAWEDARRETRPLAGGAEVEARLSVRHWRHVELPALMRIYRENASDACGRLERSEPYWRWLISRAAFDQIFVALEGNDQLAMEEEPGCRVVGYAVVREGQVWELMIEPGHPTAGQRLLARACSEAIERGWNTLRMHGPPDDGLHEVVREAGGSFHRGGTDRDVRRRVWVPDTNLLLEKVGPALAVRAAESGLALPTEIGLRIDGKKWQLRLSAKGATLVPNKLGRSYVTCDATTWTRLLLGGEDAPSAIEQGRLDPSTSIAADLIAAIFPQPYLWRPPWDQVSV